MNEDFWLIYLNYLGEKHTRNNIGSGGGGEQRPHTNSSYQYYISPQI
jgi:hypothetical protein